MVSYLKRKINQKMMDLKYSNSFSVAAAMCNAETFGPLKGCNRGKDVVLCGAGPSLNQYLPMEGKLHVALNRALLNERINYDWFIADDWDGIFFFKDVIENYDCIKHLSKRFT